MMLVLLVCRSVRSATAVHGQLPAANFCDRQQHAHGLPNYIVRNSSEKALKLSKSAKGYSQDGSRITACRDVPVVSEQHCILHMIYFAGKGCQVCNPTTSRTVSNQT